MTEPRNFGSVVDRPGGADPDRLRGRSGRSGRSRGSGRGSGGGGG